jgi:N-methylhydantoinase A
MRFAIDTGGTFTDLVVEDEQGLSLYKAPTTPDDPVQGILDVLQVAAEARESELGELLARASMLVHGTTRAVNAIVTGSTARTAFLTTAGHPDVLVFREGGRTNPFDHTRAYPEPYVPRALTFEVPERIGSQGEIVRPLDEPAMLDVIERVRSARVEAIGVCLLWSTVNSAHEERVGELLAEHLPGVPFTLSHVLNPSLREYRRASSTVIDASLKPVMTSYFEGLERRLRAAGFAGRVLMLTSRAGVLDAARVAAEPIHSINSGPSMAPIAGRHFAAIDAGTDVAIVADTGGTTYDVSLVRHGRIPWTRETWLGPPYFGHMTGFPSVDIKSIGAGGGSIAWVDDGALLHVGPQSAGAVPGPVAYGRGGTQPTVTDASLVLGHLDPDYFLGGRMALDVDAARRAIAQHVAAPLALDVETAAAAVIALATDQMVMAIKELTVNQGVDPSSAVLIGGGGAAGLNSVAIASRLGCRELVIPEVGAALSAAGGLMSDISVNYALTFVTVTTDFDLDGASRALADLRARCVAFAEESGAASGDVTIEFAVEARYEHQVWELDVPLPRGELAAEADVHALRRAFDAMHREVFGVEQPEAPVEILNLHATVSCRLQRGGDLRLRRTTGVAHARGSRRMYFAGVGRVDAAVIHLDSLTIGEAIDGPAVIESPFATVVLDPGSRAELRASGSLVVASPPAAHGQRAEATGAAFAGEQR